MSRDRNNRDKEMASRLKREGVRRTSARCAICHHLVALARLPEHLMKCQGRR